MTETRDADTRDRADEGPRAGTGTLADVSHTHPDTGRSFGGNFTFARGGAVAADGGRPDVVPEDGDGDGNGAGAGNGGPDTLKDVDHTPPNSSEDANRVFERGEEAREQVDIEAANAREEAEGEDE